MGAFKRDFLGKIIPDIFLKKLRSPSRAATIGGLLRSSISNLFFSDFLTMPIFPRMLALIAVVGIAALLGNLFFSEPAATVVTFTAADRHFTLHVRPVLEAKCTVCHGADPDEIKGELDLTSRVALLRGGESGEPSVTLGHPEQSLLIDSVHRGAIPMPPKEEDRLTDEQIATLEKWIAEGAPWPSDAAQWAIMQADSLVEENDEGVLVKTSGGLSGAWTFRRYQPEDLWAYQPVRNPELEAEGYHPIDVLIERRLHSVGLVAAPKC